MMKTKTKEMKMSKLSLGLLFSALLLSVGCDFENPLAGDRLPLGNELIGTWNKGTEKVTITKGPKPDTYKVHHLNIKKEGGATTEESLDFEGWLVKHDDHTYFNLQQMDEEGEPGSFIIAEIAIKEGSLEFKRINRDFPEKYDPQKQGNNVGLAKLGSADLLAHIGKNHDKANFFESEAEYKKAGAGAAE